jgi:membrane protease subunit HflK
MPWNNQGGGPWGGGENGPWGGGGKRPANGDGGRQGPPADLDALIEQLRRMFGRLLPPGRGKGPIVGLVVGVVVLFWLATGIYRVLPDEQGVVLRFGAYSETTGPGLHYHLPQPIESVLRPKVTRVNRTDVGMAIDPDSNTVQDIEGESLMLTGDENIIDVNLSVFWVVRDAKAYLFNIRNPELTVKAATESAVREVVGRTPIAAALAQGRAQIETGTQDLLQSILDSYGAGIQVTQVQLLRADPPQPVIESFRDVQRARTDMERLQNEAQAYAYDVVPRARGDATRVVQQAEAYRQQVVAQAQGDAQRFTQVYNAWKSAQDVTSERLYLETMEQILKNAKKVVLDRNAAGPGVLPFLPLDKLGTPPAPSPSPSSSAGGTP